MELILGGYAQGKLAYAQSKYQNADVLGADALERIVSRKWKESEPEKAKGASSEEKPTVIFHQFHLMVRACINEDGTVDEEALGRLIDEITGYEGALVVICDEIGNGVVPTDPIERTYREETGRALIALAARAERVERIVSGIAQQIKP